MKIIELVKDLKIIDLLALALDEKGYSDAEIATICEITPQTLHNAKKRLQPLTEALKLVNSQPSEYGDPEINKVVKAFSEAFGNTKTTKYDRFASKRLIDKHGTEPIINVIHALALSQTDKYCPTVNNVSQVENKLPQIVAYLSKKSNDQVITL